MKARLRTFLWQCEAFALTPDRIGLRFAQSDAPRVVCTSIPKAGTNLLLRALCLHPLLYRRLARTLNDANVSGEEGLEKVLSSMRPGQILSSHLRFSSERSRAMEENDVKHIFILRDPRDIVVSYLYYVRREKRHYLHDWFMKEAGDDKEGLRLIIAGNADQGLQSIGERLDASAGWLVPPTHGVRFEELVGEAGGGSSTLQRAAVRGLFDSLALAASEETLHHIATFLHSNKTRTFRRGGMGDWRDHFDAGLRDLFKDIAGRQLIECGYEKDFDW